MPDVRKLIVTFLIFAALASTSSLALLSLHAGGNSDAGAMTITPSKTTAVISGNAFVPTPKVAEESGWQTPATGTVPVDSNNLTDRFANSFINNLVAANPDGPRDAGDGNKVITTPTAESILTDVATGSAYKDIQVPDWDFEAAKIPLQITTSSSDTDLKSYSDALNNIANSYVVKTNLQGMVSDPSNGTLENVGYIAGNIGNALNDVASLSVPANLSDFQKNLVKLLVYEKNTLALVQNGTEDPLKMSFVLQAEDAKYQAAMRSFNDSWNTAVQNKTFAFTGLPTGDKNGATAFLKNLFGIPTAHAQYITFDPTTFAQLILQYAKGIALQILKNTLVPIFQNKVLSLINNAGNPLFIQNWSGLLSNAFNTAAGSALGQIIPGLCTGFSTDVTAWLKNTFNSANITPGGFSLNGAAGTNCTLQTVTNNLPGYYTDFNTGGWAAFGSMLSLKNNPFGAFALARDQVASIANSIQGSTANQGVAGQGYKSQSYCKDGSQPNPGDGNLCDDGTMPFVTTPGSTWQQTIGENLNASIRLIVNANDITGLAATIAGALLQNLTQSFTKGL